MKPKKFNKKLVFNKETIADLSQNDIRGGKPSGGGFTCDEMFTCKVTCDPISVLLCEMTVDQPTCLGTCDYTRECC